MRIPCNGSRGKETPAVTRCKFTASVRPGCKLQDISVVERVVHLTEERCFTDLPVICIGVIHHFCTGSNVEVISKASDRKSTRLNSSHVAISYAVFCLIKKNQE